MKMTVSPWRRWVRGGCQPSLTSIMDPPPYSPPAWDGGGLKQLLQHQSSFSIRLLHPEHEVLHSSSCQRVQLQQLCVDAVSHHKPPFPPTLLFMLTFANSYYICTAILCNITYFSCAHIFLLFFTALHIFYQKHHNILLSYLTYVQSKIFHCETIPHKAILFLYSFCI